MLNCIFLKRICFEKIPKYLFEQALNISMKTVGKETFQSHSVLRVPEPTKLVQLTLQSEAGAKESSTSRTAFQQTFKPTQWLRLLPLNFRVKSYKDIYIYLFLPIVDLFSRLSICLKLAFLNFLGIDPTGMSWRV